MQQSLTPGQQLTEVDELLRTMPTVKSFETPGPEHYAWLGRASALVHRWDPIKAIAFDTAVKQLGGGGDFQVPQGAGAVMTMLYHVRYDAVLRNPSPQSVSIASGAVFDYFDEVRKVVQLAKSDVLFVDPFLDTEFVSRYLSQVSSGVKIRLLTRERISSLLPAVSLYNQQNAAQVQVRSLDGLHDRYVFIDSACCYQSGASFKDGARNSPTTLTQINDAFQAVLGTYETLWASAKVHL